MIGARTTRRSAGFAVLALIAAAALGQDATGRADANGRTIVCAAEGDDEAACRVALPIYIGWRVFGEHCALCHGADAQGSGFAPDLTVRAAQLGERRFVRALDHGYLGPTDPPRGANPAVAPYYAELWAYLAARASGELPPAPLLPLR